MSSGRARQKPSRAPARLCVLEKVCVMTRFSYRSSSGRQLEPGGRELDVGLVDDDDVVGVGLQHALDALDRGQQAGGRVGVGEDDGLVQALVPAQIEREVRFQRQDMLRDVQQLAQHRVKAVGDVGKGQRRVPVAEGAQRQQQVFVAAVAAQHVFRPDAPVLRNGAAQRGVAQVGVQPQPRHGRRHRRRHAGGRRVGVLVGVELDDVAAGALLAGV